MRFAQASALSFFVACALPVHEPGPGRAVLLLPTEVSVEFVDGDTVSSFGRSMVLEPGERSIGFVIEFRSVNVTGFPVIIATTCWVGANFREAAYRIAHSSYIDSPVETFPGASVWLEDEKSVQVTRAFCDNYLRKEIPTPCQVLSPVQMPVFEGNLNFPASALFKGKSGVVEFSMNLSKSGAVQRVSDIQIQPKGFSSRAQFGRKAFSHWTIEPDSIVEGLTDRVRARCTFDHPSSAKENVRARVQHNASGKSAS